MTESKENRGFSNFGFSTILLSFVMICVVTFSALSLVTAYSDYKLSKKVADNTQMYYEAQEKAYEKLADIDRILTDRYCISGDSSTYYNEVCRVSGELGTFEATTDGYYLSFQETISEDRYLSVKLSIHYPKEATDTFWEIVEWKAIYTREAPEDEVLNLIQ